MVAVALLLGNVWTLVQDVLQFNDADVIDFAAICTLGGFLAGPRLGPS